MCGDRHRRGGWRKAGEDQLYSKNQGRLHRGDVGARSWGAEGRAGAKVGTGICLVSTCLMSVPLCGWCRAEEFGVWPKDTVEAGKGFSRATSCQLCAVEGQAGRARLGAERLTVHRAGAQRKIAGRTLEGPQCVDEPQIHWEEAAKPLGFTWKCLSCGMWLFEHPNNSRFLQPTQGGNDRWLWDLRAEMALESARAQPTGTSGSVLWAETTAGKPDRTREISTPRKPRGNTFVSMTHSCLFKRQCDCFPNFALGSNEWKILPAVTATSSPRH